ncbi:MAG TPA: tRNA lysidine(34) synthetase TilS [Gemmatimonadales bacterium]
MDLLHRFRAHLASLALPPGRALVGVSGGPDSMALLELLARSVDVHRQELIVAHADHGIHPRSTEVSLRVREAAEARGLASEVTALGLGAAAGETIARAARHAWLARTADRLDAHLVFLGHHGDDQAETVLMRALEGSGPAGLAGMPAVAGRLVRPLLPFSRTELAEFAHREALPVWIDPANTDSRHLRSWIRCDLLPVLRRRLPDVDRRLRRLAGAAARQRAAWDAALTQLPELDVRREEDAISVAGAPLQGYDSALSEALVMAAARRIGCPVGPVRAARILRLVAEGRSGAETPLGAGWRAELAFGRLRLARVADVGEDPPWVLEQASGERLWGRWRLRWRPDTAPERQERAAFVAWFSPAPLEVRAWRPGDRVRPLAGRGRRLVVRCFQDRRVSRRHRMAWPVLARQEAVVWVPGVCRSDALLPAWGTEAVRVDAEYA